MIKIILLITAVFNLLYGSQVLAANWYLGTGLGYSKFSSDKLDDYDVSSVGMNYSLRLSAREADYGYEFFYSNLKSKGNIFHDNLELDLHQDVAMYGAAFDFSTKILYVRLGYAFYKIDHYAMDGSTRSQSSGLSSLYGANGSDRDDGFVIGIGKQFKFWKNKFFYVEANRYNLNQAKSKIDSFELGITFFIK